MKNIISLTVCILFVVLSSCNSKKEEKKEKKYQALGDISQNCILEESIKLTENELEESFFDKKANISSNNHQFYQKKIIKNGSISIIVKDIEKGKKCIDTLIKKLNAYYEKEEFKNDETIITYDLKN